MIYPPVTVVVLNFNGLSDTIICVKSLIKTRYPNFTVYVVDNGSKVDETKILKSKFSDKRLIFIRNNKNYGFSGGNNRIIKKIKDKYVVLLNNDAYVTPNWLNHLVRLMEGDNKIGAAQPKILWATDKKYFDYAGACGGFIDIFGYPFTRGRVFYTQEKDKGQYNNSCNLSWASGAAIILSKKVLDKVGLLDESFFNYMEEIDLCLRIQRAGYRIVSEPKSVVYHKGAATASKTHFKKRFWEHRNNLMLMLKNYSLSSLLIIFPARLLLEYVSLIHYLYQRNFKFAAAVIASQVSLLYFLPEIINKRKKYGKPAASFNFVINKSIIYEYFVLKKRRYSQIIK